MASYNYSSQVSATNLVPIVDLPETYVSSRKSSNANDLIVQFIVGIFNVIIVFIYIRANTTHSPVIAMQS